MQEKGIKEKKKREGQKKGRELISPADYRYGIDEVAHYLSDEAFLRYKCAVECALVRTLHKRGLCSAHVVQEIVRACQELTADEVSREEAITKHDIRALANCIRKRVSDGAKPFVHFLATSYDIVDTANALRYKEVMSEVVVPELLQLELRLLAITASEANTIQIGRTHGQHAMPITLGFAFAGYVDRIGSTIMHLRECANALRGKFSGAVGAYNASSLFFDDPEQFEREVLEELGLEPARYSSQIVPHEPMMRLMHELVIAGGVIANIARDIRHLQRTEIGELAERFKDGQVGSSTMPHKKNPVSFENIESMWKILIGRAVTVFMDQISEHQRDLTGSASQRTYAEIVNYLVYMARRMDRTLKDMCIVHERLVKNLHAEGDVIGAEPLYILLAFAGHPDAHEESKKLSLRARDQHQALNDLAFTDQTLASYFAAMDQRRLRVLRDPAHLYIGIADKKARSVARHWNAVLNPKRKKKTKKGGN